MAIFEVDLAGLSDQYFFLQPFDNNHDCHPWLSGGAFDDATYLIGAASKSSPAQFVNGCFHEHDALVLEPTEIIPACNQELACDPTDDTRDSSPTFTSYASTSWSDEGSSLSLASPELHAQSYHGSDSGNLDTLNDEDKALSIRSGPQLDECCVAMHDVQQTADVQPVRLEDGPTLYSLYGYYAQEGYEPLAGSNNGPGETLGCTQYDFWIDTPVQHEEPALPTIRRRRPRADSAWPSRQRISKRSQGQGIRSQFTNQQTVPRLEDQVYRASTASRAFPCPLAIYGCTSSFVSKNEWKRHVATQHMRLGFWRCDICIDGKHPNDFNRKDLFTQHVRRMHMSDMVPCKKKDEQYLQDAATRCYRALRTPPQKCRCLFCDTNFRGSSAWDERMEHVARHLEDIKKSNDQVNLSECCIDELAEQWMVREKILVVRDQRLVLNE